MEAVRVTPNFDVALLRGKGFKPGEKPAYESNSAGEPLHGTVKIDKAGEFTGQTANRKAAIREVRGRPSQQLLERPRGVTL